MRTSRRAAAALAVSLASVLLTIVPVSPAVAQVAGSPDTVQVTTEAEVASYDAQGYRCEKKFMRSIWDCTKMATDSTVKEWTRLQPSQIAYFQNLGWSCSGRTCTNPNYDVFVARADPETGVETRGVYVNRSGGEDPDRVLAPLRADGFRCEANQFDANTYMCTRSAATAYAVEVPVALPGVSAEEARKLGSTGYLCTQRSDDTSRFDCEPREEFVASVEAGICVNELRFGYDSQDYQSCISAYRFYEPHTFLPAWRWRQVTDLQAASGFLSGALIVPMSALANILFLIASFIWALLLFILRFGTSLDVLAGGAGQTINGGFISISQAMQISGVWVLLLLLVAFLAARSVISQGSGAKIFRLLAGSLIPIALLFALSAVTASPSTPLSARSQLPVGSPAWIGVTGVRMVDQVGGAVSSGLANIPLPNSRVDSAATACDMYRNRLAAMEEAEHSLDGDGAAMSLVSKMWETSFLTSWMSAQYGSVEAGSRMYCFDLEARLGTTPALQADILREATRDHPEFAEFSISSAAFQDSAPDDTAGRAKLFMFAACELKPDGTVAANPTWQSLGGPDDTKCQRWVGTGEVSGLNWGTAGSLRLARNNAGGGGDVAFAYNTVRATWGHNSGQRVTEGMVAVLTALAYLYALGGVAMGSILAQYGLFLMLLLLPVTLTMLAIPSDSGRRNQTGMRMLKITGGFFFAKMALTLVMSMLVVASTLLGSLVPARAGGSLGAGSMLSLAHAFVPLVSLFLVRKLLSTLGLGDITRMSGALGLATAASAAASGDRKFQSDTRRALAGSRALGALDRAEQRRRDAARGLAARKAASVSGRAKQAWSDSDTRGRLDPLLGRKDAEGKVLVPSALGRGKSKAREAKAAATAAALGWAVGRDKDGNAVAGGGNRIQKALGGSKIARQAFQESMRKRHVGEQAHQQMRSAYERNLALSQSLRGATREERQGRQEQWTNGLLATAQDAYFNDPGTRAAGIQRGDGLLNAAERQTAINEALTSWGVRDPAALAGHVISSEEGGRPKVVAGTGRRGPDGSVTGRFEGMPVTPRELRELLSSNPEMVLSPEAQKRRAGETESEYHARLSALMLGSGHRDAAGVPVDMVAMSGLSEEQAEHELAKALRGEPNAFDYVVANVDARTSAAVDAAMVSRKATSGATGQVSAEVKLEQLNQVASGVETMRDDATRVNETVKVLSEATSMGASASDLISAIDAMGDSVEVLCGRSAEAVTQTMIFEQDVDGKQNLAEVLAQVPQKTATFDRTAEDMKARLELLKGTVVSQVAPAQQTIAAYKTGRPTLEAQLAVYKNDEAALQQQLRSAESGPAAAVLEQQLGQLADDPRHKQLLQQFDDLERDHKEAQQVLAVAMKSLQTQLTIIDKAEVGSLSKRTSAVRDEFEQVAQRSRQRYSAAAGTSARTATGPPLQTRFDKLVSSPLP